MNESEQHENVGQANVNIGNVVICRMRAQPFFSFTCLFENAFELQFLHFAVCFIRTFSLIKMSQNHEVSQ